jgi:WD40 repeat protein
MVTLRLMHPGNIVPERAGIWAGRQPAIATLVVVGILLAASLAIGLGLAARYNRALRRSLDSEAALRRLAELRETSAQTCGYAAAISLAQRHWLEARCDRAIALLERQKPQPGQRDVRDFAWRYLWRACHTERSTARPFENEPVALAFADHGNRLVVGYPSNSAEKRDGQVVSFAPSGKSPASPLRRSATLRSVCAAPFGGFWAALDGEGLWLGNSTAENARRARGPDGLGDLAALAPDGRLVAAILRSQSETLVQVIDTATGQVSTHFAVDLWPSRAAFGPGGSWLAVGGNPTRVEGNIVQASTGATRIEIWDLTGPRRRSQFESRLTRLAVLAVPPDGSTLIAGGSSGTPVRGALEIWDTAKGTIRLHNSEPEGEVACIAIASDASTLSTGGADRIVRIWQIADVGGSWSRTPGTIRATFRGHLGPVTALAYSPDGRTLASADRTGVVKCWDPALDSQSQPLEQQPYAIQGVAFTPDARTLISAEYANIRTFDPATGRRTGGFALGHWAFAMALAPDGRTLATAGEAGEDGGPPALIRLWDLASGRAIADLAPREDSERATAIAFSPDGTLLAAGVERNNPAVGGVVSWVELWDPARQSRSRTVPDSSAPLAFAPDGSVLAAVGPGGVMQFYDPATGAACAGTWPRIAGVTAIAFSPDGTLIAAATTNHGVAVWDLASGRQRAALEGLARPLAFAPDGLTLLARDDRDLVLVQVATWQELLRLNGHIYAPDCIGFAPDASAMASGGGWRDENDGVRLWRAPKVDVSGP